MKSTSPAQHRPAAAPVSAPFPYAKGVVVAVWAIAAIAAFWFVGTYATDIPWGDEFDIVPVMTGHRPFEAGWLWEPHNEHRIPLPRVIRYALLSLSGTDFRVGPFAIVATLSVLGLWTARIAARLRGHWTVTDAFFPLVWLHWGQVENLIWGFQVQFVAAAALSVVVLSQVLRGGNPTPRMIAVSGACLLLLPLCGSNGVLAAAPMTIWLADAAWNRRNPALVRRMAAGFAAGIVIILAVYVHGLPLGQPKAEPVSLGAKIDAALACSSMGIGMVLESNWKLGGVLVLALMSAAAVMAVRARRGPDERMRATGLAAIALSSILMVAAVGHARGASGSEGGLQSRYSTLLIPGLCVVYWCAELYLLTRFRRPAGIALLVLAVAMQANAGPALEYADGYAARRAGFCGELDDGWPSFLLAEEYHHHPFGLLSGNAELLDERLVMLHDAGVGRFARMRVERRWTKMRLTPANSKFEQGRIVLLQPQKVFAIELIWGVDARSPHPIDIAWRDSRRPGVEGHQTVVLAPNAVSRSIVRVDEEVDEIRIQAAPGARALQVLSIKPFVEDRPGR